MKKFRIYANGYDMGVFSAESEADALEAYAQEARYESFADMEEQLGSDAKHDVVEVSTSDKKQGEEKQMRQYKIFVNHFNIGIFEAESEDSALETLAQKAGYQSFADMNAQTESEKPDEYEVVEVSTC